ncbi:unnamed protein product, partial [marine sediment metagenome]
INLLFTIPQPDTYRVLVQNYETPNLEFNGVKFRISDEEEVYITPSSRLVGAFNWISLGDYQLEAGQHAITATSLGGAAAISKVAIIPTTTIVQAEQNLSNELTASNIGIFQVFEDHSWIMSPLGEANTLIDLRYSNGQALMPSGTGIQAGFYVVKGGEYTPQIRVSNDNVMASTLKISVNHRSIVIDIPPYTPPTSLQLETIDLQRGHHQINITNIGTQSASVVDNVVLFHNLNGNIEASGSPSEVDYVKLSDSLYEVQLDDDLLVFIEAQTDHWQLIGDEGAGTP